MQNYENKQNIHFQSSAKDKDFWMHLTHPETKDMKGLLRAYS